MTNLQVVTWLVEKLIPYARNARTHSAEQVAQVAASIAEFGWTNPILAGADGIVIAGHARLLAARKLGMTEVPVIVLDRSIEGAPESMRGETVRGRPACRACRPPAPPPLPRR